MTQVEFLNAIVNSEITDEVVAYANDRLAKHADSLAKAKAKRAEKAQTNDANVDLVAGLLTSTPKTCSTLVAELVEAGGVRADEKPITPQYIATVMKKLVDGGKAIRVEVKGEKGKIKAYTVADAQQTMK